MRPLLLRVGIVVVVLPVVFAGCGGEAEPAEADPGQPAAECVDAATAWVGERPERREPVQPLEPIEVAELNESSIEARYRVPAANALVVKSDQWSADLLRIDITQPDGRPDTTAVDEFPVGQVITIDEPKPGVWTVTLRRPPELELVKGALPPGLLEVAALYRNERAEIDIDVTGEGRTLTFEVEAVDPDGAIVFYHWSFGDDCHGAGRRVEHTYAGDGPFQPTVILMDEHGWESFGFPDRLTFG
ncbi:MAG: PKD domain-containing protein [Actinomycetota bacterium]